MKAFISVGIFFFGFLACGRSLIELGKLENCHVKMNKLVTLIVTSCYQDPYPVVVFDNYDYNLAKVIQAIKPVPIVSYNPLETINWGVPQLSIKQYPEKANFIFISIESMALFHEVLSILQHTSWWNHMAVFIVVDQSSHSCTNHRKLLTMLWNNDILTSYFLCCDENDGLIIFTYNPYTNRAPAPWRPADTTADRKYHHSWTLYRRVYHDQGSKVCRNFDFDRTRYFDGYNKSTSLVCISTERLWSTLENYTKTDIIKHHLFLNQFMKDILNLDVFIKFHFVNLTNISAGNNYKDTVLVDFFNCAAPMWQLDSQAFHFHPVIELETVIVSRRLGLKTPLEIIADYYGFFFISMTVIILFIIYCVIIVSQNQDNYSFAFFEVLRLLRNTSLVSQISSLKLRIFFAVIFLYFLVLHATFSGNLSAFLTQSKSKEIPETLDDLKSSSIKNIFVPWSIRIDHLDPKVRKKIVITDDLNCKMLFDKKSYNYVCITFKKIIINYMEKKLLRISRNYITRDHFSYSSRNTWPLNQRINKFLMTLEQSHLIYQLTNSYIKSMEENIKRKIIMKLKKYRPVKLNDLMFAFYFLALGLLSAVICFFIEIKKFIE